MVSPSALADAPTVTIRTGRPGDEAAIASVVRRAYDEYCAVLAPALHAAYLGDLHDLTGRDDGAVVLVAERSGAIVGAVRLYLEGQTNGFGWPTRWAVLRALAVDPTRRRGGVARQLLAACTDRARAAGAPAVGLHTATFMTGAVALYERMGFVRQPDRDVLASDAIVLDDVASADVPVILAYVLDLGTHGDDDPYPLPRSAAETRRLVLQGQVYGPITRQFLASAGITRGIKVLDLGSGAGDVVLALADLVGPEGRVVGIDLDGGVLQTARARVDAAGWTNVEMRQGDIGEIHARAVDGAPFDAVVGRWILMYQDDPGALLRSLQPLLRPGGIVAFLESADLTVGARTHPSTPTHERMARWLAPPPHAPTPTLDMGLRLRQTFVDAGLREPHLRQDAPIGGGERWPGYQLAAETIRSVLPLLEQLGTVTAAEADVDTLAGRLRDEVVASNGVQILPAVVGAWCRRP